VVIRTLLKILTDFLVCLGHLLLLHLKLLFRLLRNCYRVLLV
jgi:hypothetical protein